MSTTPGGLGRRYAPDPRDARYPMTLVLDPVLRAVALAFPQGLVGGHRHYRPGSVLDQGDTGTCVAHAWRTWLSSAPLMTKTGPVPFDLYDRCIAVDEWTDNDADPHREMGTSVRAGVQVLRTDGHIANFLWATERWHARAWLLAGLGTLVVGTDWRDSMSDADDGWVQVDSFSPIVGGHAYLLCGANDDIVNPQTKTKGAYRLQNSWGAEWGHNGRAWISYESFNALVYDARWPGEVCAAVEQKVTLQTS